MGKLKAGTSKVNITSYAGINLSGFGSRTKGSLGIHDDLYAKAAVLDDGKTKVGIVSCDLLNLDESSIVSIRERAQRLTEINGENIFISTTHTHSGPLTSPLRGFGVLDREWVNVLEKKIAGAIFVADNNLKESKIGAGKGYAEINLNRREKREDRIVLGANPGGVIDHEVGVIRVDDIDDNPMCVMVNYACHPVVLGGNNYFISADFPGYAMKLIEKVNSGNAVAMFLNGTTGNLNPTKVGGTFEEARQRGTVLAAEAIKVYETIDTSPDAEIHAVKEIVNLRSGELPSEDELKVIIDNRKKEIKSSVREYQSDREITLTWAEDALRMTRNNKKKAVIPTEIQVLRLGDIILTGIPGEVFVEIGLEIKAGSPFKYTFPIGYTNGCIGYMPTKKAFQEGGYETHTAYRLYGIYPMDQDVAEKVVKSALRLIEKVE
jgi:hypothetical protein